MWRHDEPPPSDFVRLVVHDGLDDNAPTYQLGIAIAPVEDSVFWRRSRISLHDRLVLRFMNLELPEFSVDSFVKRKWEIAADHKAAGLNKPLLRKCEP